MKNGFLKKSLFGIVALSAVACGDATTPDDAAGTTPEGKIKVADGKSDAWNARNDPRGLRTQFKYNIDELPQEGASSVTPWAASYWPMYEGGTNFRWQGLDILSPVEKYDKAFNNWQPDEEFMDLAPYDPSTCEWDEAYYEQLGPATMWTEKNTGNWRAHDGIDGDNDGVSDKDECDTHDDEVGDDWDFIASWWGICHAWAPAAIMEEEPVKPVTRNGVTFEVSDLKGLLIQEYNRTNAYSIGGRCYDQELQRDEDTGRILNDECRDLNPGSWHVAITNLIGLDKSSFVIERTTSDQIWNQPMRGYEITEQRDISLEEALVLLELDPNAPATGTGEFTHEIEEGSALANAMLHFANNASFTELDDDARMYSYAARNLTYYRPVNSLKELDAVPYIGSAAFRQLKDHVEKNDLIGKAAYVYNPNAVNFVEVRMTTDWLTESYQSTEPLTDKVDRYTRHDNYHYILELDENRNILGGEWVGASNENHPDFIWLPVRATSGNPNVSLDTVRDMIKESRADVVDPVDPVDGLTITSTDVVAIPDNDATGATSALEVADSMTIKRVSIDLQVDHTYRGDLIIELQHGSTIVNVYNGGDAETPWDDDVVIDGKVLDGFAGANASGAWTLNVVDTYGADVGNLVSWTLTIE